MINPTGAITAASRLQTFMTGRLVLLLALAALGAVLAASDPLGAGEFLARQAGYGAAALAPWQAWSLIAIVSAHVALWIALLHFARRLFRHMADGVPASAAESARTLSYLLWGMLIWGICSHALVSVSATWGYPAGQRVLSVALGMPQITLFFSALMAGFMAHALALGAELWQDHQEVI